MIIVAQKDQIINYDNVITIYNVGNVIEIQDVAGGIKQIGKYATEERAEKVLQGIVNKYKQYNIDSNKAVTILPKVYEMPKE